MQKQLSSGFKKAQMTYMFILLQYGLEKKAQIWIFTQTIVLYKHLWFPQKHQYCNIYRCNKTEVTIKESYKDNKSRWKVTSSKTEAFKKIIVLHGPYFIRTSTLSLNPGIWTLTKRYVLRSFLSEAWISTQVPFYYVAVWSGLNKLMFSRHGALEFHYVLNKK